MFSKSILICVLFHFGMAQETRIAGGTKVSGEFEYKFLVSLRNNSDSKHFCSGVIINDQSILTSASCVEPYNNPAGITSLKVVSNTLSSNATSGKPWNIAKFNIHPLYKKGGKDYNVAVIKLVNKIEIISGIPIPMLKEPVTEKYGIVSGWGLTLESDDISPYLLEASIDILPKEKCQQYMAPEKITDNMLCTYQLYKDACQGDEGGPLLVHSGGRKVAGIISWGVGCGYPKKARVYVNVPALYKDISELLV